MKIQKAAFWFNLTWNVEYLVIFMKTFLFGLINCLPIVPVSIELINLHLFWLVYRKFGKFSFYLLITFLFLLCALPFLSLIETHGPCFRRPFVAAVSLSLGSELAVWRMNKCFIVYSSPTPAKTPTSCMSSIPGQR